MRKLAGVGHGNGSLLCCEWGGGWCFSVRLPEAKLLRSMKALKPGVS